MQHPHRGCTGFLRDRRHNNLRLPSPPAHRARRRRPKATRGRRLRRGGGRRQSRRRDRRRDDSDEHPRGCADVGGSCRSSVVHPQCCRRRRCRHRRRGGRRQSRGRGRRRDGSDERPRGGAEEGGSRRSRKVVWQPCCRRRRGREGLRGRGRRTLLPLRHRRSRRHLRRRQCHVRQGEGPQQSVQQRQRQIGSCRQNLYRLPLALRRRRHLRERGRGGLLSASALAAAGVGGRVDGGPRRHDQAPLRRRCRR
mmetsp:Transcript_134798/g.430779  ORF Transcript_134798/g.430779 Transcript_134798/m.430779 type:complete len:252 (-) Transcript_134798:589-1344(-)